MRCTECRTSQPDDALTCPGCGALLATSPEEFARLEQYRRRTKTARLCFLRIGITSSTAPATAVAATLAQAVVEREQAGEIVTASGDGLLAVFASPAVAVECALALQDVMEQYRQGRLTYGPLAALLLDARLPVRAEPGADALGIHLGLHEGLAAPGGEMTRAALGPLTQLADILCRLAAPGQTYLSDTAYDHARAALDHPEALEWQAWKKLRLSGLRAPVSIMAVGRAGDTLLPPALIATRSRAVGTPLRLTAVLVVIVLLVSLLTAGAAYLIGRGRLAQATPAPHPVAATLSPAPAVLSSDPLVAAMAPTSRHSTLRAFRPERLKGGGNSVTFVNGSLSMPGKLWATETREGLLIAIILRRHADPHAVMALNVDGNNDGRLQARRAAPYEDFRLTLNSPGAKSPALRYQSLNNGQPNGELPLIPGVDARSRFQHTDTLWLYHLPFSAHGLTRHSNIRFQLQYWPRGQQGDSYCYPAGDKRGILRRLYLPN